MKSIILLEVIFASIIIGVIFFTSLKLISTLGEKNNLNYASNIAKLDFEATREFLSNQIKLHNRLNVTNLDFDIFKHLIYNENSNELYYDGNLLLHRVTSFKSISKTPPSFRLCLKPIKHIFDKNFNICQTQVLLY